MGSRDVWAAAVLLVIFATACAGRDTGTDPYLAVYSLEGDGIPTGDISGTLLLDGECLWIDTGAERYLALWPSGTELREDDEAMTVNLTNGDTFAVAAELHVGGGEVVDQDFLGSLLDSPVPEACAGQSGWLVTEAVAG